MVKNYKWRGYQQLNRFCKCLPLSNKLDYWNLWVLLKTFQYLLTWTSPAFLTAAVSRASTKFQGNQLPILHTTLLKKTFPQNGTHIQVFGYYPLEDISEYDIIRVPPILLRFEDRIYHTLYISYGFLAIDCNNQLYVHLNDEEFKNCNALEQRRFVYSPSTVKNIETHPNWWKTRN